MTSPPPHSAPRDASKGPDAASAFAGFALDPRLVAAVEALGFETPTPIQESAIPALLAGKDVIGRARTGSGKTAAFGLPLLERVKDGGAVRALVLAPTRELALQVSAALKSFAKQLRGLRIATVYGGAAYRPQLEALKAGASVVVGTPGRLIDLLDRGAIDLSAVEYFVLDEADEMLRMGFIDDVKRLLSATPSTRQAALFSATMPPAIRAVAREHLKDPMEIRGEDRPLSVEHIDQLWLRVPHRVKLDALERVLRGMPRGTTLVFTRTRAACAEVAEALAKLGMGVEALHGDLEQAARERVLRGVRAGRIEVLVATDVASRGIDVDHITHVINFDLPDDTEGYVHRIGRTGRAGRAGTAVSFVTPGEMRKLSNLERALRVNITPMKVPTDADIARKRQRGLQDQLEQTSADDLASSTSWLESVVDDTGWDWKEIATAAVELLARKEGLSLARVDDDSPPDWAQPKRGRRDGDARGGEPRRKRELGHDEVFLFFPMGYSRGVRPGDLVGLLANEADVPVARIGLINVLSRESFVALPKTLAEQVVQRLPKVSLRGTEVSLRLAHPGSDLPRAPQRKSTRPPPPRAPRDDDAGEASETKPNKKRPPKKTSPKGNKPGEKKPKAKKPNARKQGRRTKRELKRKQKKERRS